MDPLLKASQEYLQGTEGTVHYTDAQYHLRQQLRKAVADALDAEAGLAAMAKADAEAEAGLGGDV